MNPPLVEPKKGPVGGFLVAATAHHSPCHTSLTGNVVLIKHVVQEDPWPKVRGWTASGIGQQPGSVGYSFLACRPVLNEQNMNNAQFVSICRDVFYCVLLCNGDSPLPCSGTSA